MMNCKEFGRKQTWPDFMVLSLHLPVGTKENHENLRISGLWAEI
jgi:hypothetical protein